MGAGMAARRIPMIFRFASACPVNWGLIRAGWKEKM